MISAIIADDESHARQRLRELLSEYDMLNVVGEATNGNEAFEMIIKQKPDVVFLDIHMPGVSVFDTLSALKNPPEVIFQTAYSEYAAEAFNINALDYILKPISRKRLEQTLQKIKDRFSDDKSQPLEEEFRKSDESRVEHVTAKVKDAVKILPVSTIHKICFEEGLSFIYTEEGRFMSDKYLNYYEKKLSLSGFFRTNRSTLINLSYISSIHPMFHGKYLIELKDNTTVDLSRRKAKELKKIIDF